MAGSTRTSTAIDLGSALREEREQRNISQRKLAETIGRDSGWLSRVESGQRQAKPDDITLIVEALGIDVERAAELVHLAGRAGQSQWLAVTLPERRQQLNALLAAERTATKVTHVAPLLIPGVLQTSEVIRSIMIDADVPADEIDERVNLRIGRRHLITRKNPAHLDVLLGEAAVRTVIGSPQIMGDQLHYLLELMELPNVEIHVVRFSAGWTPALAGAFIVVESDEAAPIVNLETHGSGLIARDRKDLDTHRRAADAVREKAMNCEATAEFIAMVLSELEIQYDDTARP
jgi:transcriptional regulator with XRE-family HTH domain